MIKVNGYEVTPTQFPDGTTQVWKLPDNILYARHAVVDWRFERESEFFTVAQLRLLLKAQTFVLYMPYLPYARQDKDVTNLQTFSLYMFASLINKLECDAVHAVDVHNPSYTETIIDNFTNYEVMDLIHLLIKKLEKLPLIVFPDKGARNRYDFLGQYESVVFEKERNASTGEIVGHKLSENQPDSKSLVKGATLLLVDDICDGGATFLSIADYIKKNVGEVDLHLFVTHGIFSKGRKILEDAGFKLYTTNSLPKNTDGFFV